MRKLLYTFSLIAALLCAIAPSAFAFNNRKVQNFRQQKVQNFRQQRQYAPRMQNFRQQRQYAPRMQNFRQQRQYDPRMQNFRQQRQYDPRMQNFRQQRQYANPYGRNLGQSRQFANQYGNQNFQRNFHTQGYGPNGRFIGGEIRDYGRSFGGYDRYYGDRFIVDREFDDWGMYGYPYPYLFSDCYDGDWLYPDPDQGEWELTVVVNHRLVTAYWDPYLGGYYYYDPYLGYIQVA